MYRIIITHHFKRQLKPLFKKDRGLKERFIESLKAFDPHHVIPIGNGVFKFRLSAEGRGKSGGYRVYIFLMAIESILTPLCIYAKSDQESVSTKELAQHLEKVDRELRTLLS